MLRSAWLAQELLTTFEDSIGIVYIVGNPLVQYINLLLCRRGGGIDTSARDFGNVHCKSG